MANREQGQMIKTGHNVLTGKRYEIYRVTKHAKTGTPADIGKYRVRLYAPVEYEDRIINGMVGSVLFSELDDAKVYAYNHMAFTA